MLFACIYQAQTCNLKLLRFHKTCKQCNRLPLPCPGVLVLFMVFALLVRFFIKMLKHALFTAYSCMNFFTSHVWFDSVNQGFGQNALVL